MVVTGTANIWRLLFQDEELHREGSEAGGETSRLSDVLPPSFPENFSFEVCPIDSTSSGSRNAWRIPDEEKTFLEPIAVIKNKRN